MSARRSNRLFASLMSGAFLCAFIIPSGFIDPIRLHGAGIFSPLSYPIRRLAQAVHRPADDSGSTDPRSSVEIVAENVQLRQEVAQLAAAVEQLNKIEDERQNLGNLKSLCTRFEVAGADAAGLDALLLAVNPLRQMHQDAAVVYPGGLVGRLDASRGSARVRLITDDGFAVTGAFVRFVASGKNVIPTRLAATSPLVRGDGHGKLSIIGMKAPDYTAAGLKVGDWVVLDDPQWPRAVQNEYLGRISSATISRTAREFMDIYLTPETDLMRLNYVWVLNRP